MFKPAENAFTRRAFLSRGLVLASSAATVPAFLQSSAVALAQAARSGAAGVPDERILVVVQLAGGNDGLNTVVPFASREYYAARPGIAIGEREVLRLGRGPEVGLHPCLEGLKSLYDDGLLSIVQGVGYPNPDRSHFKSMDIWHTATSTGAGAGWLGRYFDNECAGRPGDPPPDIGVAIGREAPRAMQGRSVQPVNFENPNQFRWSAEDADDALAAAHQASCTGHAPARESNAAFLLRTAMDARVSSDAIRAAVAAPALVEYPRSELASQLAMVGAMIRAGLKTRVYYVSMGGFDTHAGQGGAQGRHGRLLEQFSAALAAFYADLKAQSSGGRVLTLCFSEFGRRLSQNGSLGTDHGAAAPVFLAGPMVRPGILGEHPSLTDLDQGDLSFTVDFRSVYAGILGQWLRAPHRDLLGGAFPPAQILRG